jgi:quercetin dioxygenase-like cupin family protein
MEIHPSDSRPSRRASTEYFTGTAWQASIVEAPAPSRVRALLVSFEPAARTFWHVHPLGQTLYIVSGIGRVQSWGSALREVRAGDVVWFAPSEKHWHGAGPTTTMVHIAIQESLDGKTVDWLEKVTDEQYKAAGG